MKSINKKDFLFKKANFIILFISILTIGVGFIFMSGGESDNPDFFNEEIFNFQRIRLAPTIIIIGFLIRLYGLNWDSGYYFHPDERSIYMRVELYGRVVSDSLCRSLCGPLRGLVRVPFLGRAFLGRAYGSVRMAYGGEKHYTE